MSKRLRYRGLGKTLRKLGIIVMHSTKTLQELLIIFFISFVLLLVDLIPCVNVLINDIEYTSLYITFIGLGVTVFAVFMTDIDKLNDFFDSFENQDNKFKDELLSLSIFSILIPLIGLVPNVVNIEGFHIFCFYDLKYWNIFFSLVSTIWLIHTVIHVLSLKIK